MLLNIILSAMKAEGVVEVASYLAGGTGIFATGGIVGFRFRLKNLEVKMAMHIAELDITKKELNTHLLSHSKIDTELMKINTEQKNISKTLSRIESKLG